MGDIDSFPSCLYLGLPIIISILTCLYFPAEEDEKKKDKDDKKDKKDANTELVLMFGM